MQIHVLAVGTRMPVWVNDAVGEYEKRMPAHLPVRWQEIKAEPRGQSSVQVCREREARRMQTAIAGGARKVLLDENGQRLTSQALADRLTRWQQSANSVALLIGGPDGFDPGFTKAADESIRLSDLTLPHPLVRIILAEQLYRASTILSGHPYHRE